MSKSQLYILLLVTALLAPYKKSLAQSGMYFTTHYNPGEYNFDNTNYALIQDKKGVVHMANRQGVLHYDGNGWWLTKTPYSIFCLVAEKDQIFVGGRNGLGAISNNGLQAMAFTSLDTIHRNISKCLIKNDTIYYINDHQLLRLPLVNPTKYDTLFTTPNELLDLVQIKDTIYLTTSENGLLLVGNNGLEKPSIEIPQEDYFLRVSSTGRLLHYTLNNNIYISKANTLTHLDQLDSAFLSKHDITEINWVTDSLIAISTFSGGILFANATTGATEQIVNYETGLPDNQIYSITTDRNGAIWALHPFGLSIISPSLPLKSFNHYQGLEGTLTQVLSYNKQLYVGTSLGLYKLEKVREVKNTIVYDREKVAIENTEKNLFEEKEIKGLFKRKKRKKIAAAKKNAVPKYKYVYHKRILQEELAVHYEFKKIKGLNIKTTILVSSHDQLLAGTVKGLYSIKEDSAYLIDEIPVLSMYGLPNKNLLLVSTNDEEVKSYNYSNDKWSNTHLLEGLNDYIVQITEAPDHYVWLCGADSLYRLSIDNSYSLSDVEVYGIDNPYFEHVYSVNYDGGIMFINSSGYYTYKDGEIIRQDYIKDAIGLPRKFILSEGRDLLVNTGTSWYGENHDIKNSLNFLSLFKDPQAIARDTDGYTYWIITATNELYKINANDVGALESHESIYLKEVRNNSGKIPVKTSLEVNQENSSLTFEFASPDYTGIYQKVFQFRLRNATGIQSPWSNWSPTNNIISYQFLPPGSYTLEARYKNVLGNIVEANSFKFKVIPPYWKRPWFYGAELIFFGGLLMLSFYLNRGRVQYTFLSRLLGFLTLILILEFFQTIAEYKFETNDSPVINFFVQAFIALLILPVEGVLRKHVINLPEDKKVEDKKN